MGMNIKIDSVKKNTEINFFLANFGSSQSYTHQFVFPTLKKNAKIKKQIPAVRTHS